MEFNEALSILVTTHTKRQPGTGDVLIEVGAVPVGEHLERYIEAWVALRKHLGMRTENVESGVSVKPPFIIAHKDEVVTCEEGHPVCTIAYDFVAGASVHHQMFKDWHDGVVPCVQPDGSVQCTICGAPWFRVRKFDQGVKFVIMHFENGWR